MARQYKNVTNVSQPHESVNKTVLRCLQKVSIVSSVLRMVVKKVYRRLVNILHSLLLGYEFQRHCHLLWKTADIQNPARNAVEPDSRWTRFCLLSWTKAQRSVKQVRWLKISLLTYSLNFSHAKRAQPESVNSKTVLRQSVPSPPTFNAQIVRFLRLQHQFTALKAYTDQI